MYMSLARPRAISGRIAPQLPRFYKHFYDYATFVSFHRTFAPFRLVRVSFFSCTRVTLLTRSETDPYRVRQARPRVSESVSVGNSPRRSRLAGLRTATARGVHGVYRHHLSDRSGLLQPYTFGEAWGCPMGAENGGRKWGPRPSTESLRGSRRVDLRSRFTGKRDQRTALSGSARHSSLLSTVHATLCTAGGSGDIFRLNYFLTCCQYTPHDSVLPAPPTTHRT